MSKAKYSPDLINSFAHVRDNSENGLQAMKDLSAFFKEKAKIDEAYAAQIKKLCSVKPGAGMFTKDPPISKETKTLKESVMAVLDQTTAISNAHLAMSQKVNEQVIKVLDEFVKVKEAEKKKLQADGAKVEQALHAELSSAKKAKEAYESAGKAAAAAHDAHTKAMTAAGSDEKKKKAAEKLVEKTDQAKVKAKQAEDAYKQAIEKANEARKKYISEQMPATLEAFQKLHQERWEQTISVLKFYASALSALPAATEDAVSKLKEQCDTNASLDEDLQEFIDEAKGKAVVAAAEPLTFEPCAPYHAAFPDAASPSSSSSSSSAPAAPAPAATSAPAAAPATDAAAAAPAESKPADK